MDHKAIANVLEKVANYIDAEEIIKQSAATNTRNSTIDTLCAKFAEATGEEVDEELRNKLASADASVLGVLKKMSSSETQTGLGTPSDMSRPTTGPRSIKEASADADERLKNWILS